MTAELTPGLTLNVPEFFARPDFQRWLNAAANSLNGSPRATWHTLDSEPGEYSDTFIIHDEQDGSDYDELLPADVYGTIQAECERLGFSYGIIRLTNLQD